jgi:predicted DNA binding CopG/RHH family protein
MRQRFHWNLYKKLLNLALGAILLWTLPVLGADELIPLTKKRQPSNDLIYLGKLLTSEEAFRLQTMETNPLDLSQLDPMPSAVWENTLQSVLSPELDEIPLAEEEEVTFKGTLTSNQGIIRFNVLPKKDQGRVFTILMEKTLHTALLRKNLLRKLGYKVPAMKYLKKIKVEFANKFERDRFLNNELPEATYGAPSRWLGFDHKKLKDDQLILSFNDVVALMPSETDHYNLAMGVPPNRLTSRTLRSLLIPYALLDVGESINKLPWTVGRIDNESIILPHFSFANMNTTLEDAQWILRRMALLDRKDFEEIIELSYFPVPVAKLLLEKLISRRNSLIELFEEEEVQMLAFDERPSFGDLLSKGQLQKEDWAGYASRFAHGAPDSPFKDFQYFVFSKLQNETISALLSRVNEELSLFDPSEKKLEFMEEQFKEGLEHFVETGEFKEFGVGTWVSPIVNGNLILSRDIVVGNYLGTDNLVQLADTIGMAISLGAIVGIENVPYFPNLSATTTVSAVRTYTHLKPVKTLKASFKEPYQNMIVPLMKRKLKKKLDELANIPSQQAEDSDVDEGEIDPRLQAVEDILNEINGQLGVGESLLITDRLTPNALLRSTINLTETSVSLSAGTSGQMVRRLHLYRKDASTIHIYEDKGRGLTISAGAGVNYKIPVFKLNVDQTDGKYKVRFHTVDINSDVSANPELFYNAKALHYLLEEGSSELLEVKKKPYIVTGDYKDRSVKMAFLVWRSKYLKGDNEIEVTTPQDNRTEYVSLTSESQSGVNYQAFIYDVLNYYLVEWTKDLKITPQLNADRFKNPGQSIFGVSETIGARYEARKIEGQLNAPFLALTTRREGWSSSRKKLKNYVKEVNEQYGRTLFDPTALNDASALRLFDITVSTNIYEDGIERLKNINPDTITQIGRRYARERSQRCGASERRNFNIRTPSRFRECQNLNTLRDKAHDCQRLRRQEGDTKEHAKCTMDLAKKMVRDFDFKDFLEVVGENNVYVYGVINGFRKDSEILNSPIPSNTIGRIRSRFWNGPLERLQEIMGIQGGEFHGKWIRESL